MNKLSIVAIAIDEREHSAVKVQETLTKYGNCIIARFGVNHQSISENVNCLITLHMTCDDSVLNSLTSELSDQKGVIVKAMTIN